MAKQETIKCTMLVYGNMAVDTVKLHDGIYGTDQPTLYKEGAKIINKVMQLQETIKNMKDPERFDTYIENLKKCRLANVEIRILD